MLNNEHPVKLYKQSKLDGNIFPANFRFINVHNSNGSNNNKSYSVQCATNALCFMLCLADHINSMKL